MPVIEHHGYRLLKLLLRRRLKCEGCHDFGGTGLLDFEMYTNEHNFNLHSN